MFQKPADFTAFTGITLPAQITSLTVQNDNHVSMISVFSEPLSANKITTARRSIVHAMVGAYDDRNRVSQHHDLIVAFNKDLQALSVDQLHQLQAAGLDDIVHMADSPTVAFIAAATRLLVPPPDADDKNADWDEGDKADEEAFKTIFANTVAVTHQLLTNDGVFRGASAPATPAPGLTLPWPGGAPRGGTFSWPGGGGAVGGGGHDSDPFSDFNPHHVPAGVPEGDQLARAPGGAGSQYNPVTARWYGESSIAKGHVRNEGGSKSPPKGAAAANWGTPAKPILIGRGGMYNDETLWNNGATPTFNRIVGESYSMLPAQLRDGAAPLEVHTFFSSQTFSQVAGPQPDMLTGFQTQAADGKNMVAFMETGVEVQSITGIHRTVTHEMLHAYDARSKVTSQEDIINAFKADMKVLSVEQLHELEAAGWSDLTHYTENPKESFAEAGARLLFPAPTGEDADWNETYRQDEKLFFKTFSNVAALTKSTLEERGMFSKTWFPGAGIGGAAPGIIPAPGAPGPGLPASFGSGMFPGRAGPAGGAP